MHIWEVPFGVLMVNLACWAAGLFWLHKRSSAQPLRALLFPAAILKISAGLSVGIIYQYFYGGGDTFGIFEDSLYLSRLARDQPLEYLRFFFLDVWEDDQHIYQHMVLTNPRAVLLTKVTSLFNLITFDNYWLTSIYLSLLSFVGIWLAANALATTFHRYRLVIAFCFFVLPSFLFWTSGILKESLLWMALGLIVAMFLALINQYQWGSAFRKPTSWLWLGLIITCLYVAWRVKYYYLAALLPVTAAIWLTLKLLPKSIAWWQTAAFFFGVCLLTAFAATALHPNLSATSIMGILVKNYREMVAATSNPENLIIFRDLAPSREGIMKNAPKAIWQGLFRPYIWEGGHIFKKLTAIEQAFLFAALVGWIARSCPTPQQYREKVVLLGTLTYCTVLLVMLPIAAPNLGNLIRYKTGFLPFLWLMLLMGNQLTDQWLKRQWHRISHVFLPRSQAKQ